MLLLPVNVDLETTTKAFWYYTCCCYSVRCFNKNSRE